MGEAMAAVVADPLPQLCAPAITRDGQGDVRHSRKDEGDDDQKEEGDDGSEVGVVKQLRVETKLMRLCTGEPKVVARTHHARATRPRVVREECGSRTRTVSQLWTRQTPTATCPHR